ncbi:DNA polymerase epsilon subunit B [Vitis vinifera]|uniref:DNA polymerase II subunit 2 n=1 Tax=Vitis vinifera TaxID=29760 RepID=A0A438JYP6_VITVI|nr:DNA polymerase epsilon subunit B [Vitis vinifera]
MGAATRKKVQRKFKIRGYTLKVEALDEILSFLSHFQDAEDEAIDLLLDELENESLKSSILDKESVHRVVSLLLEAEAAVEETPGAISTRSALRIVDAFLMSKFCYDPIKKIFYENTGRLAIHGDASAKSALYRNRFLLLFQRLSRDQHFSKPAFDTEMSHFGSCEISPIQSLIGQTGKRWVMGVISQLEDGHFFLEDLTASVEINLSNAISFTQLTVFFSIYGWDIGLFALPEVSTCGFPPLEDRDESLASLSGLDFFGGGTLTREETVSFFYGLEKKAVNDMFVILSDVWLDNEERRLWEASDCPGWLRECGGGSFPIYLHGEFLFSFHIAVGKLGQMIASHPRLKEHSQFLFIPGPDDAGPSTVLPRCALPNYLTEEFRSTFQMPYSPHRIKFYTQEIVLFRQDLLYRMRRSCLVPPSPEETSDPFEHLVATITHQSHLCPLPLSVQPIIWNYDHCLHLYPNPHTVLFLSHFPLS